jgi:hypothetical protein
VFVNQAGLELIVHYQNVQTTVMKEVYARQVNVYVNQVGLGLNARLSYVLIIAIIMVNVRTESVYAK